MNLADRAFRSSFLDRFGRGRGVAGSRRGKEIGASFSGRLLGNGARPRGGSWGGGGIQELRALDRGCLRLLEGGSFRGVVGLVRFRGGERRQEFTL